MIDTPWKSILKPLTEKFPEFENLVSQKICMEYPLILFKLQQKLLDIAFMPDRDNFGVKIIERLDEEGNPTGLLLAQISHPTKMTDNEIIELYHNGMIDYLEIKFNRRTESLMQRFGDKFIEIIGNISTHSKDPIIGCKIFSSFPYMDDNTYIPAKKRIFVSHRTYLHNYLQDLAINIEIDYGNLPWVNSLFMEEEPYYEESLKKFTEFYRKHRSTPKLPERFRWQNYVLLGEGHYIQIYAHENWKMLLPFIGDEDDEIELEHIINRDDDNSSPHSPQSAGSIPETHRDF